MLDGSAEDHSPAALLFRRFTMLHIYYSIPCPPERYKPFPQKRSCGSGFAKAFLSGDTKKAQPLFERLCFFRFSSFVHFSMVYFQKSNIVSVARCGFLVVFKKKLIQHRRDFRWADPLVNGEIPGVLTFFAPIDQPYVHSVSVGVHSELAAVDVFLLFSASPATAIYPDRRELTSHVSLPIPSSCG